eukprot:gene830-489_t
MRFSSLLVAIISLTVTFRSANAALNCDEWRWSDADGAVHRLIGTDDTDDCSSADALNEILGSCPDSFAPIRCKPNSGTAWACSDGTANAINSAVVSLRRPNPKVKCVLGLLTGGPNCLTTVDTIDFLVNEWNEDSTAFDGCRVTTTATSTASSTASTTAATSLTSTATSTATSREHYGSLTCSSLYGQPECLLSVRDAHICADHANVLSKVLEECGLPPNTISCAPVDGHFILIMTPLNAPTGTLSMGGVANISPGTLATFRLNPTTLAYEYWETRPLLGEDTTVCTAISKVLYDAVNSLYEWRSSTPQTPFGCTFVYLHGGVAKGGQYDSVDYLNELLDKSKEGYFPECRASTTTVTSTATTTATSSATTTATTTVGRASMVCTQIYGISMLASDVGISTCLQDAHYLHEIVTTCTPNATRTPKIDCYRSDAAVFVTTPRDTCLEVAVALTNAFDGHTLGGSIGCVPTGFVDENGNLLSALRPPEDISGGCATTADLLNRLIVGYMDYSSCALPTITTTTTVSTTTSSATVSTTVPLTPSLTLVFQADIAADQELGFSDAIIEALLSTGTILANELVAVDLFGGSVIAVIGFKSMDAKNRAQRYVASSFSGLAIKVGGRTYLGVIFGATPKPAVTTTTTMTTETSTTTPDPATVCRRLSDEIFATVPVCADVIEKLSITTTNSPVTAADEFNLDLEFHVALSALAGNTVLGNEVRKQLGQYISDYLDIPFTLEQESVVYADKSDPNWVDPTGCTCFSSLIPYVLDRQDWAACPVSAVGVNSPASLGEYTLACASVEEPTQPLITGVDLQIPDLYLNMLATAVLDCNFCPTFSIGTETTLCANLPGQEPCPPMSGTDGSVSGGSSDQAANATSTAVEANPTQWTATAIGLMVGAALLFVGLGIVGVYLVRTMSAEEEQSLASRRSPAQEMRDLNILASKIRNAVSRSRPNTTTPSAAAAGAGAVQGQPGDAARGTGGGSTNMLAQSSTANPLNYPPATKPVDGVEGDGALLTLSNNGTRFPCLRGTFSPQTWAGLSNIKMVLSDPVDGASQLQRDVKGKGVIVMRGGCSFVTKAKRMQDAGALCCIIVNTDHQVMPKIMQTATAEEMQIPIAIPTVLVRYLEGNALIKRLERGLGVEATLAHKGWETLQRQNANFVPLANSGEQIYKPASSMAPSLQGYLDISRKPEKATGERNAARAPLGSQAPSMLIAQAPVIPRPPLISPISSPPKQHQGASAAAPVYEPIASLSAAENVAAAPVAVRTMVQNELADLGFAKQVATSGAGEATYADIQPAPPAVPAPTLVPAAVPVAVPAAAAKVPPPAENDAGSALSISSFASSDDDSFMDDASEAEGGDSIESTFNAALGNNAANATNAAAVTLPVLPAKAKAPAPALRPHPPAAAAAPAPTAVANGFAVVKTKRPPPLDMNGSHATNAFAVVKRKAPQASAPADNGSGDGAFSKPPTHYHPQTVGESVIAQGSAGNANWWE